MFSKRLSSLTSIIVSIIFSSVILSCKENPPVSRRKIDIVFTKTSSAIFDESGKLTSDGKNLFSEITSIDPKCNYTYILDPEIIRPDIGLKHSIATVIERSGVVETTKPQVVVKYLKQKLDTLSVPENFVKNPTSKVIADSSFFSYIQSDNLQGDSVIVFMTNQKNSLYEYNGKKYKTFSNIDDTRKQIQSVLCSSPKATIALLIDPPAQTTVVPQKPSPTPPGTKPSRPPIGKDIGVYHGVAPVRPVGDLTILKGSEGCDICTRYYTAYDATGHVHEIKEKNSTNCCPCNKTVEIRGQTFVMNCDGSPRLQVVE